MRDRGRPEAQLPEANAVITDERKITAYLLAADHPAGRAKAVFFYRLGFRIAAWHVLHTALLGHAQTGEVIAATETAFGKKYIVDGILSAPDGRRPRLRSVWFIATGETVPRLVTAYPVQGGER